MEFFGTWTANTTIGGFLLWHLLFRWFGFVFAGMLFWLVLSRIRSLPLGLVTCSAILLLEYHWFTAYDMHDAGYYLASINVFHLLSVEDIAGRYLNYNLFGYPVHEKVVLTALLVSVITDVNTLNKINTEIKQQTKSRIEIAYAFGHLLSYSDSIIEQYIQTNNEKEDDEGEI